LEPLVYGVAEVDRAHEARRHLQQREGRALEPAGLVHEPAAHGDHEQPVRDARTERRRLAVDLVGVERVEVAGQAAEGGHDVLGNRSARADQHLAHGEGFVVAAARLVLHGSAAYRALGRYRGAHYTTPAEARMQEPGSDATTAARLLEVAAR